MTKEHEDFIKWCRTQGAKYPTAKNCYGEFVNASTAAAWSGWRAANKQRHKETTGESP